MAFLAKMFRQFCFGDADEAEVMSSMSMVRNLFWSKREAILKRVIQTSHSSTRVFGNLWFVLCDDEIIFCGAQLSELWQWWLATWRGTLGGGSLSTGTASRCSSPITSLLNIFVILFLSSLTFLFLLSLSCKFTCRTASWNHPCHRWKTIACEQEMRSLL